MSSGSSLEYTLNKLYKYNKELGGNKYKHKPESYKIQKFKSINKDFVSIIEKVKLLQNERNEKIKNKERDNEIIKHNSKIQKQIELLDKKLYELKNMNNKEKEYNFKIEIEKSIKNYENLILKAKEFENQIKEIKNNNNINDYKKLQTTKNFNKKLELSEVEIKDDKENSEEDDDEEEEENEEIMKILDKWGEYDQHIDDLLEDLGNDLDQLIDGIKNIKKQIQTNNDIAIDSKQKALILNDDLKQQNKDLKEILNNVRDSKKVWIDIFMIIIVLILSYILFRVIKN